jgi:hypothetical protein
VKSYLDKGIIYGERLYYLIGIDRAYKDIATSELWLRSLKTFFRRADSGWFLTG